jgi:hypothetical protein
MLPPRPACEPGAAGFRARLTKAQRQAYKQFIRDMVMHFGEVRCRATVSSTSQAHQVAPCRSAAGLIQHGQ